MGQYKYLFKNIGLLTLSSFATKLLSFFLVPLYTNILTTTEYGVYDLFNTTIGVLIPVLTVNIQDAVLRFALDKKYDRQAIVTVATRYLSVACAITLAGLVINGIFGWSEYGQRYAAYFFLMFLAQATSGIVLAYIRGIDRIAELSISSVVASAVTIGCNILFLAVLHWELHGYFLANILGPLMQCIYLIVRSGMVKDVRHDQKYTEETHEMLSYCKPLIANTIAWWVNNASDRYVVIFFCGLAENGIYSVASKIPSILNIFQSIFSQAWTLSAVKDFDPEDKGGLFSNTYRAYNCLMVIMCSAIIVADKILAKYLYAKDFYVAWRYVPWLTIAIVFGSLSGHIGGIFAAVKNSKIFAQSTVISAVTNIILNIILTPIMGPLGAAIATTICYFEVWAIRLWHSRRFINMRLNLWRDGVTYVLLIAQAIILITLTNEAAVYALETMMFAAIVALYGKDVLDIANKMLRKLQKNQA